MIKTTIEFATFIISGVVAISPGILSIYTGNWWYLLGMMISLPVAAATKQ